MTKLEFLNRVGQELGLPEGKLMEDTQLTSLREWDSMGKMAVLVLLDTEMGIDVPQDALKGCNTGSDLIALADNNLKNSPTRPK